MATGETENRKKRQRTDNEEGVRRDGAKRDGVEAMFRSTDLWFEDGNLILLPSGNVQFKVHRGVIARHSPVLSDMLSIPQPPDGETVDGCPVVRLPDSAKDWSRILKYIYEGAINNDADQNLSFSLVSAMVRLGHKYDFAALKKEGVSRLSRGSPSSLAEWLLSDRCQSKAYYFTPHSSFCDAVNLAVKMGLKRVLPAMYLHIVQHANYATFLKTGSTSNSGTATPLLPEVLLPLALGYARIQEASNHVFSHLLDRKIPTQGCTHLSSCTRGRTSLLEQLAKHPTRFEWLGLNSPSYEQKCAMLCKKCCPFAKLEFEAWQTQLWQDLPTYFGLPPWDKLENFDFS